MYESQLIEGCKKNDRKAQQELYEKYHRKMVSLCLRYVSGDSETARDLTQEGFAKVFTSIRGFSGTGSFEGWMRKVFVNCALEYLRKWDALRESVGLEYVADPAGADMSVVSRLTAEELMGLIAELPAGFRTVFNLFAIEGFSHKEIGEMLHITESTSRSQLTRAKQLLQHRVKELYGIDG
ncbi:MAG: sigma-70 family RNA polymerase sigma factor [Tannerellaceae bacterium]|jgi:RNA polymerase sigma-70 factor (ECF subfamily)|nr:sigma-70 family RNA polymerase sigma factor [Tannerellaceae bacterium]